MALSRSDFLRLSIISSSFVFLPGLYIPSAKSKKTNVDKVNLLRHGKSLFYNRDYEDAELHYQKCISDFPGEVSFYDGLAKVYGSQQKLLERAEIYRQGWVVNDEAVVFYDRLASSLRSIALGSHPQLQAYKQKHGSEDLLDEAAYLYEIAMRLQPDRVYLKRGMGRIQRAKKVFRKHTPRGRGRVGEGEQNRGTSRDFGQGSSGDFEKLLDNTNSRRLRELSIDELKELAVAIDEISRRPLAFEEERKSRDREIWKVKKRINRLTYQHYLNDREYEEAEKWALSLLEIDANDTDTFADLKKMYTQQGRFTDLVELHRKMDKSKPTYWSKYSLASALLKLYNSQESEARNLQESIALYGGLINEKNRLPRMLYVLSHIGLGKCYAQTGSFENAKTLYVEAFLNLEVDKRHLTNMLLIGFASIYLESGESSTAQKILSLQLQRDVESMPEFPEERFLRKHLENKDKGKVTTDISLLHSLASIEVQANNLLTAKSIYQEILQLQPNDVAASSLLNRL